MSIHAQDQMLQLLQEKLCIHKFLHCLKKDYTQPAFINLKLVSTIFYQNFIFH